MINDTKIWEAVKKVQLDLPHVDLDSKENFVATVAAISTKATLELLGMKNNSIELSEDMQFPVVFAEWAQQFILKNHYEHVLAAMLYLREREGINAVSTADIGRMYEKARWKKPANMADVFAKGAERIYFAEAETESEDGLKLWQMTRTGYEHLINIKAEVAR